MPLEPTSHLMSLIIFILLIILSLAYLTTTVFDALDAQNHVEKSMIIYTLSSIINSMVDVEEGTVFKEFENLYDIKTQCSSSGCTLSIREENQKNPVEKRLFVKVEPSTLLTKTVCIEKSNDEIILKQFCN